MLKKSLFALVSAIMALSTTFTAYSAETSDALKVQAKSAIIIEQSTGNVIFEQNPDEKLAPASVTKVMTLLLIYDSVANGKIKWDDMVTISEHAASMGGSQIFLEPNEQQSVKDLTKSIAIASANDAAVAMAEFIGGSEDGFVKQMNERARQLGMTNTNFENACGLDTDNHLMSARDIALMSRELMKKYPDVKEYTTTWQDKIVHTTKKGSSDFGLTNTNKLVKWYNGATGLKTGSTGKALYCLSGTAQRDGLDLIAVVMAAPDPKVRFQEVMKMFDYGFANYGVVAGKPLGEVVGSINVYKGIEDSVNVCVSEEVKVLIKKGENKELVSKVVLCDGLKAPLEKGAKAGEILYYFGDEEVGRCDLITEAAVEKAGLNDTMKNMFFKWFL